MHRRSASSQGGGVRSCGPEDTGTGAEQLGGGGGYWAVVVLFVIGLFTAGAFILYKFKRKRPGRTVYAQMHNEKEQEMTSTVSHSEDVQGAVQGEEFIDDDLDSQTLGNVRPKPTPPSSRPPRWATVASKTHRTPVQQTLLGQLGPLCPSV
nr:VPS10 domain-containing receptor SorCS2-like [Chlorocebus sabaeus]